ncbi:MAG: sensor histidine kinase [Actinomycetia bacterium]|nr:sensor histidine kinase [Actinomycetes bacterium]
MDASEESLPSVRRELIRFAVPGVLILVALAALTVWLTIQVVAQEAERNAIGNTKLLAQTAVEPLLVPSLKDGDRDATSALDELVRRSVLGDTIVIVRVWDASGQIIYSNNPELIGSSFPLSGEARRVLAEGGAEAEVSDLTKPENRLDEVGENLVEVYLQATGSDGQHYLLETYQRPDSLSADVTRMTLSLVPLIAGSLIVLTLILVGLGYRMARRLSREQRQREQLLRRAIDASDAERRRIAADLHDGVVQDLAGVAFSVAGVAAWCTESGDQTAASRLRTASEQVRQAVTGLRTLLVEIYPPNIANTGLSAALNDLVDQLPVGIHSEVDLKDTSSLSEEHQLNCYRMVREALVNISKHSRASWVHVTLRREGPLLRLVISDDGVGFDPGVVPEGHVGLQLLQALARDTGGSLAVESKPGRGTTLTYSFEEAGMTELSDAR